MPDRLANVDHEQTSALPLPQTIWQTVCWWDCCKRKVEVEVDTILRATPQRRRSGWGDVTVIDGAM